MGKVETQISAERDSQFLSCLLFDRNSPMKTARRWLASIVLLALAVLDSNGAPNKEGHGSPPYRPVVRFRHKVLMAFFLHLLCVTTNASAFAKYETNYHSAFFSHQMTLLWLLFFCPLQKT